MALRYLISLFLVICLALPVEAAKWQGGCPLVKHKLLTVGKPTSKQLPFRELSKMQPLRGPRARASVRGINHVGHELTIELDAKDVAKSNRAGGFSIEPNGNSVVMVFNPVGRDDDYYADPIVLPPVPFTATSSTSGSFVIPDSRPLIGRLVVGPASIIVFRGETLLFDIPKTVIMPPMNDMRAIADDGYEAEMLGALDHKGNVWFPLGFSGFGENGESLPECPTVLTPVTAFAVGLSLKKDEDEALPYVSMGQLKANYLFLGDYLVFGKNFYGNKLLQLDVQPLQGNGVVLCALNDAIQLIAKIPLQNPALGKGSALVPLVRDGSPVRAKIHNISADDYVASVLERVEADAFKSICGP